MVCVHIVYWDAGPARASALVSPILPWTDSPDSDSRLYIGPPARWPCPVAAAWYGATASRGRTGQCFGESHHNPAGDRDRGLYNVPPALWPCPVAAARYGATAAGAAKLEVFRKGPHEPVLR